MASELTRRDVEQDVARAGGSSASASTRCPVTTSPPAASSSATSAAATALHRRGPSASRPRGRIARAPARTRRQAGDRGGASNAQRSRRTALAPRSPSNRPRARPRVERSAGSPNRSECQGMSRDVDDRPQQLRRRASRRRARAARTAAATLGHPRPGRPQSPPPTARALPHARRPAGARPARPDGSAPRRARPGRSSEERRGQRQRHDRRAHVVAEPGQCQLHVRVPPPGSSARLVDADRAPGTGHRDRRRQAVGSCPTTIASTRPSWMSPC